KTPMLFRDQVHSAARAVRIKGGCAFSFQPAVQGVGVASGGNQRLFVVSQQGDQSALSAKRDQLFEDAPTIRTTIDVVAQNDNQVVPSRSTRPDQGPEGHRTTVNVPDRNCAACHTAYSPMTLTSTRLGRWPSNSP